MLGDIDDISLRFVDICIPPASLTIVHLCMLFDSFLKKKSPTFSLRLLYKVTITMFKNLTKNKTINCSLLSRHFYHCIADEAGYLALYPHL